MVLLGRTREIPEVAVSSQNIRIAVAVEVRELEIDVAPNWRLLNERTLDKLSMAQIAIKEDSFFCLCRQHDDIGFAVMVDIDDPRNERAGPFEEIVLEVFAGGLGGI